MAQRLKPQQAVDQLVNAQTSLVQVKTLLQAGIGCITYLRGLFPEESFDDHKLLAPRPPVSRSDGHKSDGQVKDDLPPSSVRFKKLKRGATTESDKLLNYLDLGASAALEKGYLHQLILAIYLDPNEPTNLVESYTFTFTYETDSEGNKRPEMVVRNQVNDVVLASAPSAAFPRENRSYSQGDVKRQVQQMIKNLITSTQLLDELPRRRFVNVRLFYTDDTPEDYEPPCFRPVGDSVPRYTLTTPAVSDRPDCVALGTMATGFHGVALHSVSIAHILETSYDDTIPNEEATERNRLEASTRNVVWDAETLAETFAGDNAERQSPQPIGIKDRQGNMLPLELVKEDEELGDLRRMVGIEESDENVLRARGEMEETLLDSNLSDNVMLRRALAATAKPPPLAGKPSTQFDPVHSRQRSFRPPVPLFGESKEEYAQRVVLSQGEGDAAGPSQREDVDVDVDMDFNSNFEEAQMAQKCYSEGAAQFASPSPETQLFDYSQRHVSQQDTILPNSFEYDEEPDTFETASQSLKNATKGQAKTSIQDGSGRSMPSRKCTRARTKPTDDTCECGDSDDDDGMIWCSSCDHWRHTACYGFGGVHDVRIPEIFICYRCRARTGASKSSFDAKREGEIEEALADLKSIALFRRAIAVIWSEGVLDAKQLSHRLSIDASTASQVLKRLKAEEFLVEQQISTKRFKASKGRSSLQSQSFKKGPLSVNKSAKQLKLKKDKYFNPGRGAELGLTSMLDLSDADAEGEVAGPARLPGPAFPEQTNQLFYLQSPQAATRAGANAETQSPNKAFTPAGAVLVEATPSPAQSVLVPIPEDDPILEVISQKENVPELDADADADEFGAAAPRVTPEQAALTARQSAARKAAAANANRAKKLASPAVPVVAALRPPQSSYVSSSFARDKGKAAVKKKPNSPFGSASPKLQNGAVRTPVDATKLDPAASRSTDSPTKRRSMEAVDVNGSELTSRRKKQKCSEASQIEV
ncbi:hypothetical protein JCM1840_003801 [Sporobolomyces johnsonii]